MIFAVTRLALHRLFVGIVVLFVVAAVVLYVLSIALAGHDAGDTARHFDMLAIFAFMGAVLFGIIDFFVRPVLRATPDGSRDVDSPLNG